MAYFMLALRTLRSLFAFFLLFLYVSIAFDVSGKYSGLAFSLFAQVYYFLSILGSSGFKNVKIWLVASGFMILSRILVIPFFLAYCIKNFRNKSDITPYLKIVLQIYEGIQTHITGIYWLLEGLSTLVTIQTIGYVCHYLVNNKSDNWMIAALISSGGIITVALYFLYQTFTAKISLANAVLSTHFLTASLIISIVSITKNRASVLECSLMFAYISFMVYLSCKSSFPIPTTVDNTTELPSWPLIIQHSYATIASSIAAYIPFTMYNVAKYISNTALSLSVSGLVHFIYRMVIYKAAARIIPIVWQKKSSRDDSGPEINLRMSLQVFLNYFPCIFVGSLTHQLLLYMNLLDSDQQAFSLSCSFIKGDNTCWLWINALAVICLWTAEMILNQDRDVLEQSIASHLKLD